MAVVKQSARRPTSFQDHLFPVAFGGFLGLSLLKFGNPPVMERFVSAPGDGWELVFGTPWPVSWAFLMLAGVTLLGIATARWKISSPAWVLALPLAWFLWQLAAATQTMQPELTWVTLRHFLATIVCFYLGAICLREPRNGFWGPIIMGFVLVLAVGFSQHFGGLEATRKYFYTYIYPELREVPPEYLKRVSSDRIFGTLFYPNSLAGVLLLLTGPTLVVICSMRSLTSAARGFLAAVAGVAILACLYWSGSKAGWLLFLFLCLTWLLRCPLARPLKVGIMLFVVLVGLAGFFWKYSGFFKRGATSVVARFDYWKAAVHTATAHPVCGTGPGTFGAAYNLVKRPESEPARLAHNDYLQQAADSGIPGFLLYCALVSGALYWTYPRFRPASSSTNVQDSTGPVLSSGWHRFAVWAGLTAWFLQGFIEFGLYVPGNAWPAFALLGWLVGSHKTSVDKTPGV